MADEDDEQELGKTCLFPSFEGDATSQGGNLLPSVPSDYTTKTESLDWLHNESYKNVDMARKEKRWSSEADTEDDNINSGSSDNESKLESYKRMKMAKDERSVEKQDCTKKKVKKHKKHKQKKHKQNEKRRLKEEEKLTKLPSTIWIEESGLDFENAFRVDRKPDGDNISFGGLYRLDIALHNLNPKLSCLGQGSSYVVDLGKTRKRKKGDTRQEDRYWASHGLVSTPTSLVSKAGKQAFGFSKNFSYVPLHLPSSVSSEESTSQNIKADAQGDSQSTRLLSGIKLLNQKVHDDPSNTKAWLELANLQNSQVDHSESSHSVTGTDLKNQQKLHKLKLEKKSAVLEKAVEKNPKCVDLVVAYMNVCVETLSNTEIVEKWKKILFSQPQVTAFWKHYLMFCQADFSTFSFSNVLSIYSKCFTTLSSIKDGSFKSHSSKEDMEVNMLEIFIQFCQFLKQTGQIEKAVAAFQALIELNCFFPESLGQDLSTVQMVSLLESFWDSDLPRFGEDNSVGWKNFVKNQPSSNILSISEIFCNDANQEMNIMAEQDEIISSSVSKPAMWVSLEMLREGKQWKPRKTSDEDEDDPDRIVLFQDIRFCLFNISDDTVQFQLICYFLTFLGVPLHSSCFTLDDLYQIPLEDDAQLFHVGSKTGIQFPCLWPTLSNKSTGPDVHRFIRNIFNQALNVFSGKFQSMLVYHWLMFERDVLLAEPQNTKGQRKQYKAVRKLAKSLLKLEQFCNNLRLWMVLVGIEYSCGNIVEARRIVFSTLQQSRAVLSNPSVKAMLYTFTRSYCEMEMKLHDSSPSEESNQAIEQNKNRVLAAIGFLVGTVDSLEALVTPAQILKTQRTLQELKTKLGQQLMWNDNSEADQAQFFIDFNHLYTLFEYWSFGIESATIILDSLLSHTILETLSGSKDHQQVLVFYCRLLRFHCKHHVSGSLQRLRQVLLIALETFPENAFFLQAYISLELKSCIAISVRRLFDRVLPASSTPLPWLAAVLYEKRRQDAILSVNGKLPEVFCENTKIAQTAVTVFPMSGVVNRIKSVFERAINHSACRHSVAVWRSYIQFEIENGNLREAKAVFYRSLQSCAWAKVLYIDAAKSFPDFLQDLHDMMEEKELRIRAPLEELELLAES